MSTLTCRDFVESVTSYLDQALAPQAEAEFVDHLSNCPGCGRYFRQLEYVMRSLRGAAVGPA
ncbi:MAG: anti-sigma factor family protein [Nocardioidaceae bacterium]